MNFNEFKQQYKLENPIYNYSCRLSSLKASVGALFLSGVPLTLILGNEGIIVGFVLGIVIYFVFQNANINFAKSWQEHLINELENSKIKFKNEDSFQKYKKKLQKKKY